VATYYRTEGVCLRRLPFSNTSQVATFLTPDRGRLAFLAKGVLRAPKRGVSCGFELLGRYELIFTERRTGSLHNLTKNFLIEPFQGTRDAIERSLCAYYAAELMLEFATENEPYPHLYELLLSSLRRFEKGEDLGLSVLLLEIGVLREQGICPVFSACVECGGKLPTRGRVLFSPSHAGPLCAACVRALPTSPQPWGVPVSVGRIALLDRLSRQTMPGTDSPDIRPDDIVAASRLLRFHMRYRLSKELRMWKYLQERHLSRSLRRLRRRAGVA